MPLWLSIALTIYLVCVAGVFIALMCGFFRNHPDGAAELNELDLITYVAAVLVVSVLWPMALLGVFISRYATKTRQPS